MNDIILDIMEEIEAESLSVEQCADTLERAGFLTTGIVLESILTGAFLSRCFKDKVVIFDLS